MDYFVYILKSEKDHRFYIGQTQDLEQRISAHNSGKSSYTKKYIPWQLYAYRICSDRAEAMGLETKLKNLKSHARMIEFIEKHGFQGNGSQEVIGPEK